MAVTLELTDGVSTLDLTTDPFDTQMGGLTMLSSIPVPKVAGSVLRDVDFTPRPFSISLRIVGTTLQDLELQVRRRNVMLSFAERRQILDEGTTKVVLKYQVGNTNSRDAEARVLSGSWQPNGDVFNSTQLGAFSVQGTLNLLMEPFGRLTDVVYVERILFPENDGNSFNFMDLAGPFNSYLEFDGASGDVTVSDAAAIQNQFNGGAGLSARIWADSDGEGDNGRIVDKGPWQLYVTAESSGVVKLGFQYTWSGDNANWVSTNTVINTGEWYRAGVEYDADATGNNPTFYDYRDATKTLTTLTEGSGIDASTPSGTRDTDVGSDFLIGNRAADDRTFDGKIDDVRWYGTTGNLAGEDKDAELVGNETNLIHYWPLDEGGSATVVNNKDTTNTETGTITTATWGIDTSISGDALAPLRVKVSESGAYGSAGNIWLATRSGERRTDQLFYGTPDSVVATNDPSATEDFSSTATTTGGLTTNAHGGASSILKWTHPTGGIKSLDAGKNIAGYHQYDIAGASLPRGLFRVLVRVSVEFTLTGSNPPSANDISNFAWGLGYVFGGKTVEPAEADFVFMDTVAADTEDEWHIIDLGEISIPPLGLPESDITPPALNIRINSIFNNDDTMTADDNDYLEWNLDYMFLLPIDESALIVPAVPTSGDNVVFASAVGDTPGIWFTTTGDVVSSIPDFNGGPLEIGPEVTRLYYLKDDTGDPSVVSSALLIEYEPQIRTL